MQAPNPPNRWLWLLWIAYLLLVFAGILRHEIWMDEAHHWLVARDSSSFVGLIQNLRYEGHPILWNILLYGMNFLSSDVLVMQLLHAAIAGASMYLVLFKSPFPLWVKALFPFGYFTLFEYALISRNYALAFLLAFAIVLVLKGEKKRPLLLGLLLALLANTHLLGLCLSLLFLVFIKPRRHSSFFYGLAIYSIGLCLAIWQIIPPEDHPMLTGLSEQKMLSWASLKKIILVFNEAFFPLHDVGRYHFWHTNWLEEQSRDIARAFSLILMLAPLWFFRRDPKSWLLFYGLSGAVLLLSALKGVNYERFHGFIFMSFMLLHWLNEEVIPKLRLWSARSVFLGLVLLGQSLGGLHAYLQDWRHPFSESKATASYLQSPAFSDLAIICGYCFGESLNAYLPQTLQYPEQPGESFCRWEIFDKAYLNELQTEDYYSRLLRHFLPYQRSEAILISHQTLDPGPAPISRTYQNRSYQLTLIPLNSFTQNIKHMEAFYLYKLHIQTLP